MHRLSTFLFLLAFLFHCTRAPAQDTVYQQSFELDAPEGTLPFTPDVAPYGTGGLPTWNRVAKIKGIPAASQGDYFWAVRDADNPRSGQDVIRLSFDAGDVCTLVKPRFVFDYNVVGYDGGDDFGYELYLDGFLHETVVLVDGRNGGGLSTDGWVTDTVFVPGTAQTARLVLFFDQNGDDVAAVDNLYVMANGSGGSCRAVCSVKLGKPTVNCNDFTAAADGLRISVPYTGAELGAVVNLPGATISGDDPGSQVDGRILLDGLTEGANYTLRVTGGDCDLTLPLAYPADQCAPSNLVINEVLAAPRHDANGDGKIGPDDEFIEIYNNGIQTEDLAGYTLHDGSNSGKRFTFPDGATLAAGDYYVVFAGEGSVKADCQQGVASGFLGLNDDTPESVTLRRPDGRIVAQAEFDDAPTGSSLVLSPAGNIADGYWVHEEVYTDPYSVCAAATTDLPVELLTFVATPMTPAAVRLDWTTAEEVDNDRFVLERSKAGTDFTAIATVPAGNGHYAHVDTEPFPGQNYYRLRQYDLDGTLTVFGPIGVRLDSGTINVYPNPTAGKLFLTGEIDEDDTITVYGSDGRALQTGAGPYLDVAHLPAGSYYLRLRRDERLHSLRFIKE